MPGKDNRSSAWKLTGGGAGTTKENDSYTPGWQKQRYEGLWVQIQCIQDHTVG
jgi:hypothetical protein